MSVAEAMLNAAIAIGLLFAAAGICAVVEALRQRRDRLEALRYRRARYRRTGEGPHS